MNEFLEKISICVERGKINLKSPYPKDMFGLDGADEITLNALSQNILPSEILKSCNDAMQRIGNRFSRNEVFVPELLMAAKAMHAVMAHLKPYFKTGEVKSKGKFIIGTVAGDLHDIGKNLVSMVVEGNGWEVIDLGVDVKTAKFISAIEANPKSIIGLSALLTTTMSNMAATVKEIKSKYPDKVIIVGGAPLSEEIAEIMGADGYASNPQGAVTFLNEIILRN
ncbi:MAG: cobalamin-dependent protein [Melioribacteraceae bacterium]